MAWHGTRGSFVSNVGIVRMRTVMSLMKRGRIFFRDASVHNTGMKVKQHSSRWKSNLTKQNNVWWMDLTIKLQQLDFSFFSS
jgi:hypothetical protein